MINIWQLANTLPSVVIRTSDGQEFAGRVLAVEDAEETGCAEDSLVLETKGKGIIGFEASDIESVEVTEN
ncbi:MAG: hypothetical protein PUC47_00280 [Oscillospiraceae bacterium]|nr:hypothetical protein [Oscillospiraceae bacterium]